MLLEHLERLLATREAQGLRRRLRTAHSPAARDNSSAAGRPPDFEAGVLQQRLPGPRRRSASTDALAEGARRYGAAAARRTSSTGTRRRTPTWRRRWCGSWRPTCPTAVRSSCTGYMANLAVLTALGDAEATLYCEELNHASLIDGARLARAEVVKYPHNDVQSLDALLQQARTLIKLIVTDAVFSMDGDLAPLDALLALAERHDAWLVVDDAHGFGVLGEGGRGSLSHFSGCAASASSTSARWAKRRGRGGLRRGAAHGDRMAGAGGADLHLHDGTTARRGARRLGEPGVAGGRGGRAAARSCASGSASCAQAWRRCFRPRGAWGPRTRPSSPSSSATTRPRSNWQPRWMPKGSGCRPSARPPCRFRAPRACASRSPPLMTRATWTCSSRPCAAPPDTCRAGRCAG